MSIDKDDLREIMREILDERARIDAASHEEHHEWISARIERDRAIKGLLNEATKVVIQWSIPAILGGVYYWIHGQWK